MDGFKQTALTAIRKNCVHEILNWSGRCNRCEICDTFIHCDTLYQEPELIKRLYFTSNFDFRLNNYEEVKVSTGTIMTLLELCHQALGRGQGELATKYRIIIELIRQRIEDDAKIIQDSGNYGHKE